MAFAFRTKDDSGNRGNLRALKKDLRSLATVATDAADVRKCIEGPSGILTRQSEFIQT